MKGQPDTFEKALASFVLQMLELRALNAAYRGGGPLPRKYAQLAVEQMVKHGN